MERYDPFYRPEAQKNVVTKGRKLHINETPKHEEYKKALERLQEAQRQWQLLCNPIDVICSKGYEAEIADLSQDDLPLWTQHFIKAVGPWATDSIRSFKYTHSLLVDVVEEYNHLDDSDENFHEKYQLLDRKIEINSNALIESAVSVRKAIRRWLHQKKPYVM